HESIALCEAGASKTVLAVSLGLAAHLDAERGNHAQALEALRAAVEQGSRGGMEMQLGWTFERGVEILVACGARELAATAAGVVDAAVLFPMRAFVAGPERAKQDALWSELRSDAGFDRGHGMTRDQAVEHVVGELDRLLIDIDEGSDE